MLTRSFAESSPLVRPRFVREILTAVQRVGPRLQADFAISCLRKPCTGARRMLNATYQKHSRISRTASALARKPESYFSLSFSLSLSLSLSPLLLRSVTVRDRITDVGRRSRWNFDKESVTRTESHAARWSDQEHVIGRQRSGSRNIVILLL